MSLAGALVALALAMGAALLRSPRIPDWLVAGVGAGVLVLSGALPTDAAARTVRELAPTLVFLAALLLLAEGCRASGLFEAAGERVARAGGGTPRSIFGAAFALAAATTVVLSLDATVLLLTPLLLQVARRARIDARPPLYAAGHLANSASLLLPISNLTNLLAFHASGLSFTRFAALMAAPWAVALAIEWRVLSRAFPDPSDRRSAPRDPVARSRRLHPPAPLPRLPLVVLALTLAGFAASPVLGIEPVWIGVAGAVVMLASTRLPARRAVPALQPGFLVFVVGLALIVSAAGAHGLDELVASVLPRTDGPAALVATALVAALAANVLNNLPATLLLLPAAAAAGPATLLAVLIGVGIGPNLTYGGSLATLLWRRILHDDGHPPRLAEFTRVGVATTVPALVLCPLALWAALQL